MLGAIAGDIIGSVYERYPIKTKEFPLFESRSSFTDDSVLTVAIADALLKEKDYISSVLAIGRRYPNAGYGGNFLRWLHSAASQPYGSWGNGSAMRVSCIGVAFDDIETVLHEAAQTARITHDHAEGIKGAQATALAGFMARTTRDKDLIRREISTRFDYDLSRTVDSIRPTYSFEISCQGTVPEAIICFLDADSYEDAVRNAVSLGGDSDTLACIAGGIAEAYYGVPSEISQTARRYLTGHLLEIIDRFEQKYPV